VYLPRDVGHPVESQRQEDRFARLSTAGVGPHWAGDTGECC
jgi:hypothetical protein